MSIAIETDPVTARELQSGSRRYTLRPVVRTTSQGESEYGVCVCPDFTLLGLVYVIRGLDAVEPHPYVADLRPSPRKTRGVDLSWQIATSAPAWIARTLARVRVGSSVHGRMSVEVAA